MTPSTPARRAGFIATGALALLAAILGTPERARAQTVEPRDTVILTSGKKLSGRVMRMNAKEVVLRVGTRDRTIARNKVQSVSSIATRHRSLMMAWQKTPTTDVARLLELATAAANSGLPHESRLLRWYAALLRPGDAAIHESLGNKKRRGGFQVKIDGKWVPFAKADALGEDFDDAWKLRSEHFTIRCAAGLRTGLNTLMELETLYWKFLELFGDELDLLELVEPIEVRLYRNRRQMPSLGNHVGAYFSTSEPALFTCFENGRPFALMHEGTHALLHHFFVRAAKSRGRLPGWLDEGWAEYMDGRIQTGARGKPTAQKRSQKPIHRRTLLAAAKQKKLYGVHRLLNFKSSDFSASTLQSIKYAQSWALFRFLLEHKDASLRTAFLGYLRHAAAGKGQASTFRRIFKRHQKPLETEPWR